MPVTVNINECVKNLRPILKEKIKPGQVILVDYFVKILSLLPEWASALASSFMMNKDYIIYTSLPTKHETSSLLGKKIVKMGGFNYMAPKGNLIIMCMTYKDDLRITMSFKQTLNFDTKILFSYIETMLEEFESKKRSSKLVHFI